MTNARRSLVLAGLCLACAIHQAPAGDEPPAIPPPPPPPVHEEVVNVNGWLGLDAAFGMLSLDRDRMYDYTDAMGRPAGKSIAPGAALGLSFRGGVQLPNSEWEVFAAYSGHWSGNDLTEIQRVSGGGLATLDLRVSSELIFGGFDQHLVSDGARVGGETDFSLHLLELGAGAGYDLGHGLEVRTRFSGLLALAIRKYRLRISDPNPLLNGVDYQEQAYHFGSGVNFGAEPRWTFLKTPAGDFSVYGAADLALNNWYTEDELHFLRHAFYQFTGPVLTGVTWEKLDALESRSDLSLIARLGLGMEWRARFISLRAGYEFTGLTSLDTLAGKDSAAGIHVFRLGCRFSF